MTGTALTFPTPASLGSLDHYIQAVNRFPLLTAEQETALGRRLQRDDDLDGRARARAVAPAAGGRGQPQLPGLRPAAGRPDPGRQRRPDEGRAPLRPGARRAPGVVRAALDPAEIHEYILRNWRLVKVATTKAQRKLFFNLRRMKTTHGGADADRGAGDREGPRRQARGSRRDGDAPVRARHRRSTRSRTTTATPMAPDRLADRRRGRAGADPRAPADRDQPQRGPVAARSPSSTTAAAGSSRRAGCARTTPRRCRTSPTSTACRPSASARSRARR